MLVTMPNRRVLVNLAIVAVAGLLIFGLALPSSRVTLRELVTQKLTPAAPPPTPTPKYKPTPTYLPPPIRDNFPLLATSTALPPIPKWNEPRENAHKDYDLPVPPPLLIGFTRTWPVLLQAVVSYITAGWPPSQIYVVENTGVQQANARGQLTLQNPFYLNHTILKTLGVNVIQTPTLLTFAQLQNFYFYLSQEREWPYFFWSHMDVLVLANEEGYAEPGYKSLYELCLSSLHAARTAPPAEQKWALRLFAYDHLTLVNPAAFDAVGGWDTLIPYYLTDCDMYARLEMKGWGIQMAEVGIVTDVATVLEDLSVLYRVDGVPVAFVDPNPPPPKKEEGAKTEEKPKREEEMTKDEGKGDLPTGAVEKEDTPMQYEARKNDPNLAKWNALREIAEKMYKHKYGDRHRNTWQLGQHGGEGEPYYYNPAGFAEAIDVMIEAGREVYRRKWGHRECDLMSATELDFDDAWKVEKDW
ncbi:hypothetical protein C8A01DRAFT_15013 [Parachaetomium inaequale]|uniref:Glycosyl transferase family 8 protein n=1 Tax=Parachaetomium inaequale TaxID=2588326 RepID=A0AAN6PI95_9PEZI|nr:hypothetical protein C8A01DRAFT_15013 [Parachaetomium inaequale]